MKTAALIKGNLLTYQDSFDNCVDALVSCADLVIYYNLKISPQHLRFLYRKMIIFCPDFPLTKKIKGLIFKPK